MKVKNFLLALIFALAPATLAQNPPTQAPASGPGAGQPRAEHRQHMMEMHKQESALTFWPGPIWIMGIRRRCCSR